MSTQIINLSPDAIKREILTEAFLLKVGEKTLSIIKRRTAKGEFLSGPNMYSVKPFAAPLGALRAKLGSRADALLKRIGKGTEDGHIWKKGDNVWVTIGGGYKRLRQLAGKETNNVTLNWTGSMLRALRGIKVDVAAGTTSIYFTDDRAGTIASYLQELGAGKRKVKRTFLALSEQRPKNSPR